MNLEDKRVKLSIIVVIILSITLGIFFRFYQINQNKFFFYDEGMWLNVGREIVDLIDKKPPQSLGEYFSVTKILFKIAINTAKSLWAFISLFRGVILESGDFYFTRLVSAIFGTLTILVTYILANNIYKKRSIAVLAAVILALLPTHIFYSRLGIQEALTTFLFTLGTYYYLSSNKLSYRVFISGILFSLVFFSNYRTIILPVFIVFLEFYLSFAEKSKFNLRRYMWNTVTFAAVIILVGNLYNGANTKITFAWMFYQNYLSQGHRSILNLLSYPYYLYKLESIFLFVFFFSNTYLLFKGKYKETFPFVFIIFLMLIFSLPQEKGVRYLCIGLPLIAIASAYAINYFYNNMKGIKCGNYIVMGLAAFMFVNHLAKDFNIINFSADYESSVNLIKRNDPAGKILSTQYQVQRLYVKNKKEVMEAPNSTQLLMLLYKQGYHYLVIDPQAYISFNRDNKRFDSNLLSYMEFAKKEVKPIKVYPHFSKGLLVRFVLEHNENFYRTIKFLHHSSNADNSALYLYEVRACLYRMYQMAIDKAKVDLR